MSRVLDQLSVLHVSTARTWRGGEQQLAYLAGELHSKGVRQLVLCARDSGMAEWCERTGVPFLTARKRSSLDLFFAKMIRDLCRTHNVNILHAHDSHAHTFAVMAASVFGNRARIIVSRRVEFPAGRNPLSLYKYNHEMVSRILCVSDRVRCLMTNVVKDPSRLATVYSGVDVSRFEGRERTGLLRKSFDFPETCRMVVNISALSPHKGLSTFVAVADELLKQCKEYRFLLVGEGAERKAVEEQIQKLGLTGKVCLAGFRNDIPEVLSDADVLLMTTEAEGLGTTILDAFACSVPVVATAVGGIPEMVIHETTGLLADMRDVQGLAANVERIFSDTGLRKQMVMAAHEHLKNFTKSAMAAATLREYVAVTGSTL